MEPNEQVPAQADEQSQPKEKWYAPLTRVTPLSKALAMVLFVVLPFVGFWLGVEQSGTQGEVVRTVVVKTAVTATSSRLYGIDNEQLVAMTRYCSVDDDQYRDIAINTLITNELRGKNSLLDQYASEGYSIQDVCRSNDLIVLFFDFSDGAYTVDSEDEKRVAFGVANLDFEDVRIYKTQIDEYYIIGPAGLDCDMDSYVDKKILYYCRISHDGGTDVIWRAFDVGTQENVVVKRSSRGRYDTVNDRDELLDSSLYMQFSKKGKSLL